MLYIWEDYILDNLLLFMNSIVFGKLYSDFNQQIFSQGCIKVPLRPNVELLNLVPKLCL